MASTFYKYAERDADSQVNWAEVGKGLSDMLTETNRVRQEKKDALDTAQRETMKYLAETPNGEHIGARQSVLEYANMASNQMRIMKQLMEQGQLDVKDYTIFRQNLTDNTNLAFNANKAYQERYKVVQDGIKDGTLSIINEENWAEVEGFGNWRNVGWQITPNGTVLAGKMIEEEVDGKKVRTLDKTPGGLRSMDYLNQSLYATIEKYDYESKANAWVDTLGKEQNAIAILGRIQQQGKTTTEEDITKRTDIIEGDKKIMYNFLQSENDKIKEIAGTNLDSTRILMDSAITAPNMQPYTVTTNAEEAKKGENYILKVVNPETGGFEYQLTEGQKEDAREFIRTNLRAKYDRIKKVDTVSAVQRDPESEAEKDRRAKDKEADNVANLIGKLYYGNNNEVNSAIDYFKGFKDKNGKVLFKQIVRDGTTGLTVTLADGTKETISFVDANGRPKTQEDFIKSAGPLLAGQVDVNSAINRGSYKKGAQFNKLSKGIKTTEERYTVGAEVLSEPSQRAVRNIQASLPKGFTATDTGTINPFNREQSLNEVTITAPNGKKYVVKTSVGGETATNFVIGLEDFVIANSGSSATTPTAIKGKASKY